MKYLRFLRVVRNRHLDHVLRPKVLRPLSTVPIAATTGRHQLVKDEYPVGRKLHGFTVQRVAEVPELCLTAVSLSHDVTGASHLHLARDDRNNVFCVGFRTTPLDSTGVPHILEHTTLCGSHKYPCRDPFFKMLNRSLSTFMNAFTASDFTMYPFSTQNPKDFKNLLHVYLDAVFQPLLRPLDFLQEGWRLEHSTVNDPKSPIVFKGVVFNEMKGALADCERLFAQHLQSHMLPSHTYSYVSGGDPLHIPDLSWEQLKRFHETHYHPSNAWFYTYGDFHLDDHLKTIDEEVLSKFDRIEPNTSVPDEIRWQQPRRASVTCRPEPLVPDPDRQTTVAVSYLLENITNSSECLALHVLSTLLVEGPNAPFYKSLLEPNIGSGFSPASGYNNQMKEAVFSVGLQGIHSNDVNKVVEIIDRTIEDVIKDGFPDDRIEAILHGIELGFKHQTSNYGLGVIMSLSSPWNHGADPIEMLQINRQVDNFKQQLRQNPRFLQDKMRQYLKDNRHRLILVMNPDEEYETKRKAAEERILNEKLCNLKESDKQVIYQQGLELNAKQSEVDDLSSLPTLKLSDVERTVPVTTLEHTTMGGVQIQFSRQPTNGLTHLRGVLNCRDLKAELKPLLPLFCQVVTKMGAGNMDYRQLAQKIDMRTGGLSVSTLLAEDTTHDGLFEEGISFYSHCLEKNSKDMFYLWSEIFNGSDLSDVDRLRTLVNDILVEKASGLPDSGHSYAMTRAAGTLNPLSALKETFQGLEQIKTMKLLAQMDKLDHLVEQLRAISKHLMTKNHLRLSINATHDYMPIAQQHLSDFVSSIRGTPSGSVLKSQDETFISVGRKQHIVLPLPVNFVSRSIPAVRFNHEDFASLRILSRLMTTKFLHREIREKGGAYGGGATANSSGLFTFYSYRDPRSLETLETFDLAETWATTEGTFSDRDIEEAKLSVFSEVDRPVAAGDKGSTQFLHGITDEMKQRHRDRLQQVSRENLHHVAATYLVGKQLCSQVILGPENNSLMGDWEAVKDDF